MSLPGRFARSLQPSHERSKPISIKPNYGCKENYHKHGVQTERHDPGDHERHGRRQSARPARRGRLRTYHRPSTTCSQPSSSSSRRPWSPPSWPRCSPTKQGGVFRWVGEAYGARTGFLAIWLQWIESTIWYPTVLTFGAVSIAFIGMNDAHDMTLASNKVFTLVRGAGHLLDRHLHRAQGPGLGRQDQQMGRYDRHDHSRRPAHPAGHRSTLPPAATTTWTCRRVSSPTCRNSTTWCWPAVSSSSTRVWR